MTALMRKRVGEKREYNNSAVSLTEEITYLKMFAKLSGLESN